MYDLLNKIYVILDKAVYNELVIQLIYEPFFKLYFQAKLWSLNFRVPFHHTIRDTVPPIETFIMVWIIWHLAQVGNHLCLACHSLHPMWEVVKPKLASSYFQKCNVTHSSSTASTTKCHFETWVKNCQHVRNSSSCGSHSSMDSKKKGAHRNGIPDLLLCNSSMVSSLFVQDWLFFNFWISEKHNFQ